MEMKEAIELERLRAEHIGKVMIAINEITNQKNMAEILEFIENKVFEENERSQKPKD